MLRLLTPSQAQSQARKQSEVDTSRAVTVAEQVAQKYRELSQAERDFDESMQRQRTQWAIERQQQELVILELTKKVEVLEARKKEALVPLATRKKELDTRDTAITKREELLSLKEVDFEESRELLLRRLDEVSEREQRLNEISTSLSRKEEGIKQQTADIQKNSANLTKAIIEAQGQVSNALTEIEKEKLRLKTKEDHLIEKERLVDAKEKTFIAREAKLQDDIQTFKRTMERNNYVIK